MWIKLYHTSLNMTVDDDQPSKLYRGVENTGKMWLSLKIDRRLEMFICDLPTVPVSFGVSWILLVEILDGGCGADPLETQMPLCGTQGYWSGEVVPTQQMFMLAEPAPILTRHL